jgi:hypothetical protein
VPEPIVIVVPHELPAKRRRANNKVKIFFIILVFGLTDKNMQKRYVDFVYSIGITAKYT